MPHQTFELYRFTSSFRDEHPCMANERSSMMKTSILIVTNERIRLPTNSRELLIKLGYEVVGIATSNDEIIAKIEEIKPDLIFTDIRLSGAREGIKPGN